MVNPAYLWRYRANAVGQALHALAWERRQWQRISAKPQSDGSGGAFTVVGAGTIDSADARFVLVNIQAEASLSIQEHVLRLWAVRLREARAKLKEPEAEALKAFLDRREHVHVWDVDRRGKQVQARDAGADNLHQALLALTYTAEVGRVERRVIYEKVELYERGRKATGRRNGAGNQ